MCNMHCAKRNDWHDVHWCRLMFISFHLIASLCSLCVWHRFVGLRPIQASWRLPTSNSSHSVAHNKSEGFKLCSMDLLIFLDFPIVFPCSFWYCSKKSCSFKNLQLCSARALSFFLPAPRHCDVAAVAAGGALLSWSRGETWPPHVALAELQAALQPTLHLRYEMIRIYIYI